MKMNQCLFGDCREVMKQMIAAGVKVHTCITSPPYWNLRDYGTAMWEGGDPACDHKKRSKEAVEISRKTSTISDSESTGHGQEGFAGDTCGRCGAKKIDQQLGMERTPDEFIKNLVDVFLLVREVLHDDGTLWVNMGDSYAGSGHGWGGGSISEDRNHSEICGGYKGRTAPDCWGLKNKDLCGMPWELALAMRRSGWYLRRDIIWDKPNPMPESASDRPSTSHEYIFLFSKKPIYFYDHVAIREKRVTEESGTGVGYGHGTDKEARQRERVQRPAGWATGSDHSAIGHATALVQGRAKEKKQRGAAKPHKGFNEDWDKRTKEEQQVDGRNKRSVWRVPTYPYKEAHFATYPPKLIEPCVLAGTSARGACNHCGVMYGRVTKETFVPQPDVKDPGKLKKASKKGAEGNWAEQPRGDINIETLGWQPRCKCRDSKPVPCVVFDPFMGSGTTAEVAQKHGRNWLGIDLNEKNGEYQTKRTRLMGLPL